MIDGFKRVSEIEQSLSVNLLIPVSSKLSKYFLLLRSDLVGQNITLNMFSVELKWHCQVLSVQLKKGSE